LLARSLCTDEQKRAATIAKNKCGRLDPPRADPARQLLAGLLAGLTPAAKPAKAASTPKRAPRPKERATLEATRKSGRVAGKAAVDYGPLPDDATIERRERPAAADNKKRPRKADDKPHKGLRGRPSNKGACYDREVAPESAA